MSAELLAVARGRRNRRWLGVCSAVTACWVLAACGGSSSGSPESIALSAPAASTEVAVPAATSIAAAAGTSIVSAPVQTAHTSLGAVAYRTLGQGQPLVMIMGYSSSMEAWDPRFVDTLAKHYRVIVFDNAGIGGTASTPGPLSIDAMADQTAALITSLRLSAPDILGWSMGSMIAQALAVQHPSDVTKLALAASSPGNGNAVVPSQTAINELKSGQPAEVSGVLYPADQHLGFDAYVADLSAYPATTSASARTAAAQDKAITDWWSGADASGKNIASIAAPTFIADGATDALDNAANSQALAKSIPNATVHLYSDAGHAFLFQEGTSFTFALESFFSGPPAASSMAAVNATVLAGSTNVPKAGLAFATALKALPTGPTSAQVAAIDVPYATTLTDYDDELLHLGTTGAVNDAVVKLVNAYEQLALDVLALSVQSAADVASWAARTTPDSETAHAASVALRQLLGLPVASP